MCILCRQIATLEEAHRVHPSARWWVKADGCDIVSGLEESLRNEWNGDVDLGTGELQAMYQNYLDRLKRISSILASSAQDTLDLLRREKINIFEDLQFVSQGKLCLIDIDIDVYTLVMFQHSRLLTMNTQRRFSLRGPNRTHSLI